MFIETTRGYIAASEIAEIRDGPDREYTAFLRDGNTRRIGQDALDALLRAGQMLPARPGDTAVVCAIIEEPDGSIGHEVYEVAIVGWRVHGQSDEEYGAPILAEPQFGSRHVGILRPDGQITVQHDSDYPDRASFAAACVAWEMDMRRSRAERAAA